ncbi:2TM domain-containing protein [Flavobacterium sp.]|uniref:2TM domain-containing protein n=1 Tax=Flavobacterium sp. TaxID=239 RepID=UPI0040483501
MDNQFELFEYARKRQKQKKRLYTHFIFFLIGSVFFIIINKVLNVGDQFDWFVWAILAWLFLLCVHFVNVFITHKFMGKDWERKQIEKLVVKQELKLKELAKKVEKETQLKIEDNTTIESDLNQSGLQ